MYPYFSPNFEDEGAVSWIFKPELAMAQITRFNSKIKSLDLDVGVPFPAADAPGSTHESGEFRVEESRSS